MSKRKPACLYHPISALFVDDNESFLDTIKHELSHYGKMLTCADPKAAIQMIKESEATITDDVAHVIEQIESEKASDFTVNLLIDKIHHAIYNPARCLAIAVIFVDYLMLPDMNGIEFCKALKKINNLNAEYVMLTAEADEETAIEAFNAGWINKFLIKSPDPALNEKIIQITEEAKARYFERVSQNIIHDLGQPFQALINSAAFQTVFDSIFQQSNAAEYYLVDKHGSYVFLDKHVNPTWFIVRSQAMIDETVEMLEASNIDSTIIDQVKNRKKLLFLPSESDYKNPEALADYLFDAHQLDESHYYSMTKGKITKLIDWDKVKPCL